MRLVLKIKITNYLKHLYGWCFSLGLQKLRFYITKKWLVLSFWLIKRNLIICIGLINANFLNYKYINIILFYWNLIYFNIFF